MMHRRMMSTLRVFTHQQVLSNLKPSVQLINKVEEAFSLLSQGKVDVPLPMHIGIHETATAGPGDCHIKGGYVEGDATWTVKLANVSFYKNKAKGMSPGSGIFIVCSAVNGLPLGVFQENRAMTDLRTGAAGAISVKYFCDKKQDTVAFLGTGAIAAAMATSACLVHKFKEAYCYGLDFKETEAFCAEMTKICKFKFTAVKTAEEATRKSDVIFTQTPASAHVLQLSWLKEKVTIIASGSDQPTKNEIPSDVMKKSKFITDLTRQCVRVGELRTAVKDKVMKEEDVYAELGEVINGSKKGRTDKDGIILVDLTGTGAQDAAIGSYAMEVMSKVK